MLLALIGSPSAGKETIANYLRSNHSFTRVRIIPSSSSSSSPNDPSNLEQEQSHLSVSSTINHHHQEEIHFQDFLDFLNFSTQHWLKDLVTTDLNSIHQLEHFIKRPFFILVNVEASTLLRWNRFQNKLLELSQSNDNPSLEPSSLEEFISKDEQVQYGLSSSSSSKTSTLSCSSSPSSSSSTNHPDLKKSSSPIKSILLKFPNDHSYTLLNHTLFKDDLYNSIDQFHLPNLRQSLRPNWDQYFMKLANLASLRSNCMKRRVGAILITQLDRRVISTGYNGTPRANCNEGGCSRCNGTLFLESTTTDPTNANPTTKKPNPTADDDNDTTTMTKKPSHTPKKIMASEIISKCGTNLNECLCLHAEENALLEAGRDRLNLTSHHQDGIVLYCNTCPCLRCSVKIVQCGIKEVVYSLSYSMDKGTAAVFAEAGVQLRQMSLT